jgi:hypothetical protein
MIPDSYILERRLRILRELPWPIPAAVVMSMTSEDFDALDATVGRDAYWRTLNRILTRVQRSSSGKTSSAEPGTRGEGGAP